MKIVINNHRKIFAIQEQFNTIFPELKLGFFAKPSRHDGPPSGKMVMHSSRTLQDCRVITRQGIIEILPTMNMSDLKDNFRDVYGLSVEISPKTVSSTTKGPVIDYHAPRKSNKQHPA
jgi:hypothetical protein